MYGHSRRTSYAARASAFQGHTTGTARVASSMRLPMPRRPRATISAASLSRLAQSEALGLLGADGRRSGAVLNRQHCGSSRGRVTVQALLAEVALKGPSPGADGLRSGASMSCHLRSISRVARGDAPGGDWRRGTRTEFRSRGKSRPKGCCLSREGIPAGNRTPGRGAAAG